MVEVLAGTVAEIEAELGRLDKIDRSYIVFLI